MAEMWKPRAAIVYKDWVRDIIDESQDKLTAWELKFIADIEMKLDKGYTLSQAQAEKLESIYVDRTS